MTLIYTEDSLKLIYEINPTIVQEIINNFIKKEINNIVYYIKYNIV